MRVDRCVCVQVTFERLKAMADDGRLDFEALRARSQCCSACKMCEPYVRRMLLTGETSFALDRKNPAPVAGKALGMGPDIQVKNVRGGPPAGA
jgi:hypothetical protein